MDMVCGKINLLRDKLNQLILQEADYTEIYKISTELDKLILLYYNVTKDVEENIKN